HDAWVWFLSQQAFPCLIINSLLCQLKHPLSQLFVCQNQVAHVLAVALVENRLANWVFVTSPSRSRQVKTDFAQKVERRISKLVCIAALLATRLLLQSVRRALGVLRGATAKTHT